MNKTYNLFKRERLVIFQRKCGMLYLRGKHVRGKGACCMLDTNIVVCVRGKEERCVTTIAKEKKYVKGRN